MTKHHLRGLLDLPRLAFVGVLNDWFDVKSLCLLDSAYCTHFDRSKFLELLKSDLVLVDGLPPQPDSSNSLTNLKRAPLPEYLVWLLLRNMSIKSIDFIKFNGVSLSDTFCHFIQNRSFRRLRKISFMSQDIAMDVGFIVLNAIATQFLELQTLSFGFCSHQSETLLNPVLSAKCNLLELSLCNCSDFGRILHDLTASSRNLRKLRVSAVCNEDNDVYTNNINYDNHEVDDNDDDYSTDLDFRIDCERLSKLPLNLSLLQIIDNNSMLRHVDFSLTDELVDDVVILLSKQCLQLTYLDVHECGKITRKSITVVMQSCLELTFLNVYNSGVSPSAFANISRCIKLSVLNVRNIFFDGNMLVHNFESLLSQLKMLTVIELSSKRPMSTFLIALCHCPVLEVFRSEQVSFLWCQYRYN